MIRVSRLLAWCTIGCCVAAQGIAAEPPQIRLNPFARPASIVIVDDRPQSVIDVGSRAAMDLRATMVSEHGSLANIAGKIISPGESVQGYQLVRVHEDRADFEFQGELVTIYVRPPTDENDE